VAPFPNPTLTFNDFPLCPLEIGVAVRNADFYLIEFLLVKNVVWRNSPQAITCFVLTWVFIRPTIRIENFGSIDNLYT
jgi:hypothetical protein